MEGQLLSAQVPGGQDVALLRRALQNRRDQLHLLSHTEREDPRRLGSRNPTGVPADPQGSQAHHAHRETQGLRRPAALLSQNRGHPGAEARRDPLPAAALLSPRPRGARSVPAAAPRRHLCGADSEKFSTPVELTADYGYFRLRDEGYTPEDLARWAQTIRTQAAGCGDVFVYFKHEEAGIGPQFARLLLDALASEPG